MATLRNPYLKALFLCAAFLAVILSQYAYDAAAQSAPGAPVGTGVTPELVRMVDMGFHSTIASALWASTMPEVLDLFHDKTDYFPDLSYLNGVDPRLSYPYAFSELILPATPYKDAVQKSIEIGSLGLANADPDWRISYYMATNYYLSLHDTKNAIWYYDIAARTPGVPQYAARFALNFGVGENEREKVKELWTTIRDTTNDQFTKDRAQAYIDRLNDLDYLDTAVTAYKTKFGSYPTSTDALLGAGIITAVPQDPFGFIFTIKDGGVVGIDLNALPSYIQAKPQN